MVRREPPEEVEGYDADAFGRSLSSLDFVPENAVDAVGATLCERSAVEATKLEAQRRRDAEVNDVLLEQGIATSLAGARPRHLLRRGMSGAAPPLCRHAAPTSVSSHRPRVGFGLGFRASVGLV